MSGNPYFQKSLAGQIFDTMFNNLKKRDEFEPHTVEKLYHLTRKGMLERPPQVVEAIEAAVKNP